MRRQNSKWMTALCWGRGRFLSRLRVLWRRWTLFLWGSDHRQLQWPCGKSSRLKSQLHNRPRITSNLPEWTVIVYSAADDEVLEENMWFDVNEMELVGSNSQMNIVVQIDRYAKGFTGDGDWSDTRRYLLTQDSDLDHIASPVVESVGEVDTGRSANPDRFCHLGNPKISCEEIRAGDV